MREQRAQLRQFGQRLALVDQCLEVAAVLAYRPGRIAIGPDAKGIAALDFEQPAYRGVSEPPACGSREASPASAG